MHIRFYKFKQFWQTCGYEYFISCSNLDGGESVGG